jgi:GT2 family glycosyltransferase
VKPTVLISILNWNNAEKTLACLESLRSLASSDNSVRVMVLDNGSKQEDYLRLRDGADPAWANVVRVEQNLGFTGGHNVSLKAAQDEGYDFVWLMNNDATVSPGALDKLLAAMQADARCGAVSPVIYPEDGVHFHDAWGCTHDWQQRTIARAPSAEASRRMHQTDPERVSLVGTAILLRTQAIREVGMLDDRLFAYYDDNEICTRLARGGWRSQVVFDATVTHGWREVDAQPLYYFYLMFRNELLFWHTHTPAAYRKLLLVKLLNQSFFNINRLRRRGLVREADSALLGVWDFLQSRYGAPVLNRSAPLPLRWLCGAARLLSNKQLQATAPAPVKAA